jgi:nitrate/nitrite transporter NarK
MSDGIDSNQLDQKKLVRNTSLRWLMLAFGCFFLMGSYFCFDNPAPLKTKLTSPPFNFSPTQFNALYSIYSFPNMILPLVGGIAMDKLGVRLGLICFTVVLTIG